MGPKRTPSKTRAVGEGPKKPAPTTTKIPRAKPRKKVTKLDPAAEAEEEEQQREQLLTEAVDRKLQEKRESEIQEDQSLQEACLARRSFHLSLLEAFAVFDPTGCGTLSKEEMRLAIQMVLYSGSSSSSDITSTNSFSIEERERQSRCDREGEYRLLNQNYRWSDSFVSLGTNSSAATSRHVSSSGVHDYRGVVSVFSSVTPFEFPDRCKRRSVIRHVVNLEYDMQSDAIELASQALERFNIAYDAAKSIKTRWEKQYGGNWAIVVGPKMENCHGRGGVDDASDDVLVRASDPEYESFMYFYLGKLPILYFKRREET